MLDRCPHCGANALAHPMDTIEEAVKQILAKGLLLPIHLVKLFKASWSADGQGEIYKCKSCAGYSVYCYECHKCFRCHSKVDMTTVLQCRFCRKKLKMFNDSDLGSHTGGF